MDDMVRLRFEEDRVMKNENNSSYLLTVGFHLFNSKAGGIVAAGEERFAAHCYCFITVCARLIIMDMVHDS